MPRLVELLKKNKLTLIAALSAVDLELARAAVAGGADALQVPADKGKAELKRILDEIKIPVGIFLGAKSASVAAGVDFVNTRVKHSERIAKLAAGASKILSLDEDFSSDQLMEISRLAADAIDAAIIPVSNWGKDLVVGDLQNYISIVISSGVPVIIPTERNIRVSEAAIISDTGARGLLLTPVVIGETAQSIEKAVREYRAAVDEIGE